ncbi:hypothetical protein JW921_03265 [Candidatus Fermentibacterales bacterium]|nr:hypothetical protein [Candidatus Fermentibacterales bacterium]
MRRPFFLVENLDALMRAKWLLPYLLVPPLLAVIAHLESSLVQGGVVAIYTHKARMTLTIWNGAILLGAISGVQASLYFSSLFRSDWLRASIALPLARCRAYWGALLAVLLVAMVAFTFTIGALVAALPRYGAYPWASVVLSTFALVTWVVCVSAFLGVIANALSSSIFILTMMTVSFVLASPSVIEYHYGGAGTPALALFLHALPPIGMSFFATLGDPWHYVYPMVLVGHSALAAVLGCFFFVRRSGAA